MRPPPAWSAFAETLDALEAAPDVDALHALAAPRLHRLGVTCLGVARLARGAAGHVEFVPGVYPDGFVEEHARQRRSVRDPLARLMRERSRPFGLSDLTAAEAAQDGRAGYRKLFERFGLTSGLCAPRRSRAGAPILGVIAGPTLSLDDKAATIAARILVEAYADRREELTGAAQGGRQLLTQRQLACLRVAANGRSSIEIAAELRLAPRTVDAYMAAAADRLGVNNRIAAVITALRLGLIS